MNKMISAVVFVAFLFASPVFVATKSILREKLIHNDRSNFKMIKRANPNHVHSVIIAIKQSNLDKIESILYDVSNISSPNYGKYLSFEEVGNLVHNPVATNAVISWLEENQVKITSQTAHGEYITAESTVKNFERMFETEFYEYSKISVNMMDTKLTQKPSYSMEMNKPVIRALSYSISEELNEHIHGIFRLANFPPPIKSGLTIEPLINSSTFHSLLRSSDNFATNYPALSAYAYPYTIRSYYHITDVGSNAASQTIYSSLGNTFLPSDLQSFEYQFGLNNVPVANYYNSLPDNSICSTFYGIYYCLEGTLDVEYISSIANNVPITYWTDNSQDYDFFTFITTAASLSNPTMVYTISYGTYEEYVSADHIASFNTEAMKLGTQGVTIIASSGDDGVTGFNDNYQSAVCGYFPIFPASSPYVTAVGGTMNGLSTGHPETTCSTATGSSITSGGGFSQTMTAPSFQVNAVNNYFSEVSKPPQSNVSPYVSTNRGYPDVAMPADKIILGLAGNLYLVYGTSASAPMFAGLVSLVNSARIQAGYSSVGWLNPSIYSNNGGYTNDITTGDNTCTSSSNVCCTIGFKAASSWDPVTGFGSVDYQKFLNYYMTNTGSSYNPSGGSSSSSNSSSSLSTGAVVGIVIGVIAILIILMLLSYQAGTTDMLHIFSKPSKSSIATSSINYEDTHNVMHQ